MFYLCSFKSERQLDPFATIAEDRKSLVRIIAGLFGLLGFGNGIAPPRIARAVHRAAVAVLRPAESATRRLVYVVSLIIRIKPAATRPMPSHIARTGKANARPCFQLFDPRLRLSRRARTPRATAQQSPAPENAGRDAAGPSARPSQQASA